MSNYLNFSVKSEDDIMSWICMQLGYPLVQVEITEEQLRMCINDSVEEFTKWVIQEKHYLALNIEEYTEQVIDEDTGEISDFGGFILSDFTGGDPLVTGVFAIEENTTAGVLGGHNTLFSVTNTLWSRGMFPLPQAGSGGSGAWVNYELALSYVDQIRRMTATPLQFEFNPREQRLTLLPDPKKIKMKGWVCLGVNMIRPDDQQYGESWVKRYALACAKVVIGNIRSKYEGTQLLGGGAINASIKEEGLSEKVELLEEVRTTYTYVDFFIGG
jgi:hypothetical protein